MSQSSVWGIAEDLNGVIWVATADGLNRFDGSRFTIYKPSRFPGKEILSNNMNTVYADPDGFVWSAAGNYIIKIDPLTLHFSFFEIPREIISKRSQHLWKVSKFESLSDGSLLIATYDGLFLFKEATGTWKTITREVSGIYDVVLRHGVIWIGSYNGFFSYNLAEKNLKEITYFRTESLSQVRSILALNDSTIILASEKGIDHYDIRSEKFRQLDPQVNIGSLVTDLVLHPDKSLIAITPLDGTYLLSHDLSSKKPLIPSEEIPQTVTFLTSENNLILGYDGKGMSILNFSNASFQTITTENGLPSNMVKGMYIDAHSRLWVGTAGKGLAAVSLAQLKADPYLLQKQNSSLLANSIFDFTPGIDSTLWIASGQGIYYHRQSENAENIHNGVFKLPLKNKNGQPVHSEAQDHIIFALPDGNLLSGTWAFLWEIDPKTGLTNLLHSFVNENEVSVPRITDFISLSESEILIATTVGIYSFSMPTKKITPVKSLQNISVHSLYKQDETLWAGGSNGLFRFSFKDSTLKNYNTKDGLTNEFIYGILPDNAGNLWLSTNAGLFCFFPESENFIHFDNNDGLLANEFNTRAYTRSAEGTLYFGGINGINFFEPDKLIKELSETGVFINTLSIGTELFRGDTAIQYTRQIELPYHQNNISFEVSSQIFGKKPRPEIGIIVQGLHEYIIPVQENSPLSYNNIEPGSYSIQYATKNDLGEWQTKARLLDIIITPPFWKTFWFYGLSGFSFAGIMVFAGFMIVKRKVDVTRKELEQKLALQKERERISRDMHDDLGSGLTQISIWSELIKTQTSDPEKTQQNLARISSTSRELITNLNEIIWALKLKTFEADTFAAYLREYISGFCEAHDLKYKMDIEPLHQIELSQIIMRNTFLIVKEVYHNILKHAQATATTFNLGIELDSTLKIHITDNGVGFDFSHSPGNGLMNMRKRAAEIDGDIEIGSTPGTGSSITLKLKIKNNANG